MTLDPGMYVILTAWSERYRHQGATNNILTKNLNNKQPMMMMAMMVKKEVGMIINGRAILSDWDDY